VAGASIGAPVVLSVATTDRGSEGKMKKLTFTVVGVTLLLAGPAVAAGTNLAWNDCIPGGGVADRSVVCSNAGAGTLYFSFVPPHDFPALAVTEAYIDVMPASAPISTGSWWYPTSISTRWSWTSVEPASGACAAWWTGAAYGPLVSLMDRAIINTGAGLRLDLPVIIAAGEEQVATAGTEYFSGALVLKNSTGTFGDPECQAGAVFTVFDLVVLQPNLPDYHFGQTAEVSNRATFQNYEGTKDVTPTKTMSWGGIKALYR
jgi:hypothetical protein